MSKTIKILVLAFILSLLTFHTVYAMDINMNLPNNTSTTQNNNSPNNSTYLPINDDYSVSSSFMPESELGFENILDIVLIVIGILLILLGIAIMIRLK